MNMGDMLVKAGDWQTAQKVDANAKLSPTYGQWKFSATLQARIAQAPASVAAFNVEPGDTRPGDAVIMSRSRLSCSACHQQ